MTSQAIKCRCCPHIETSQLICCVNQLTGCYTSATLAFNGLSRCNTVTPLLKNLRFSIPKAQERAVVSSNIPQREIFETEKE